MAELFDLAGRTALVTGASTGLGRGMTPDLSAKGSATAHQGWSADLFTTASDMFPMSAVRGIPPGMDGELYDALYHLRERP